MKICTACTHAKPLSAFYLVSASDPSRGHRARCRDCCSQAGRKSTPEERARKAELARAYRAAQPARRWVSYLKRYNWTPEDYFRQLAAQGGRCAICKVEECSTGKRFSVDHDHACCPGATSCGRCNRGLLCRSCNIGLGMFHDNLEALAAAIAYLSQED